jgi:hypothetical protein
MKSIESTKSHTLAIQYVNQRDKVGVAAFDTAVTGEFFETADLLTNYEPDFLTFALDYKEGSSCRFNFLGYTCCKAEQLMYLLNLIRDPSMALKIDNKGVTILHAVTGVPIGLFSEQN